MGYQSWLRDDYPEGSNNHRFWDNNDLSQRLKCPAECCSASEEDCLLHIRLDPLTLNVVVALRLVVAIHNVYECICGTERTDQRDSQAFVCLDTRSCYVRHNEANATIKGRLTTASCPAHRESQVYRSDNKRPDGNTLTSWMGLHIVFHPGVYLPPPTVKLKGECSKPQGEPERGTWKDRDGWMRLSTIQPPG
ncbi:hypothetical protein Hamer_G006713 [Homarus americanus]|uniref:Uncharacterized protein n=1 Tax=Homarus americanus TaxID=6706 RepID=A0A8J5JHQ6_HOMAM|nr:hypothetical protein Hamer_G006713 [Homarus americanus]